MLTLDKLDEILTKLNIDASMYEALVISSMSTTSGEITIKEYLENLEKELLRLGTTLFEWLMKYIHSIIWCYANTPFEEGDIIRIDVDKHAELGKNIVKNNKNLIGMYVLPLVLYGAEYVSNALYTIPKSEISGEILGYPPEEFNYESFLLATVEVALQARYAHLRNCHLRNKNFSKLNFGHEKLPLGNLLDPVE